MRYRVQGGSRRGVTWIEICDDDGNHVPQGYVIDFSSERETGAWAVMLCGFVCALVFYFGPEKRYHGPYPWSETGVNASLVTWALGLILRLSLNDYRIVDARSKKIWMHRKFLRWVTVEPEADFTECAEVVLQSVDSHHKGWRRTFRLYLVLSDGSAIRLLDEVTQSINGMFASTEPPQHFLKTLMRVCDIVKLRHHVKGPEWAPVRVR